MVPAFFWPAEWILKVFPQVLIVAVLEMSLSSSDDSALFLLTFTMQITVSSNSGCFEKYLKTGCSGLCFLPRFPWGAAILPENKPPSFVLATLQATCYSYTTNYNLQSKQNTSHTF